MLQPDQMLKKSLKCKSPRKDQLRAMMAWTYGIYLNLYLDPLIRTLPYTTHLIFEYL